MKKLSLIIRIVIAVGLGAYLAWFLFAGGKSDEATKLMGIGVAIFYGIVLFLLFGFSFMQRVADKFGNLYMPPDENFQIVPEYSVAEARRKVGDYAGAVAEYRKVIAQWPTDVFAHVQIAEIAIEQLHDLSLAESELLSATAKAETEDTITLTHNRLADFYQFNRQDLPRAVAVIEQLCAKLPGTRAAQHTVDRLAALNKIIAGELPVPVPAKIQYHKMDEAVLRKRRGF